MSKIHEPETTLCNDDSALEQDRSPQPIRFSAARILRQRHGLTQRQVSDMANIVQAEVGEMEKYKPFGRIEKYRRLAAVYNVPVDVLLKNDLRAIPEGALNLPEPEYTPAPSGQEALLGRQGEELALEMEKARLNRIWPALSDLVMPYYKTRYLNPGFDILSLDDYGQPFALEVKTSLGDPGDGFWLTPNEMSVAKELTRDGVPYIIRTISNWGTEQQEIRDVSIEDLEAGFRITPLRYRVQPKLDDAGEVSGICHFRRLRELTQNQLCEMIGINRTELSMYETGARQPSVDFYIRASEALDTTVDSLLERYEQ